MILQTEITCIFRWLSVHVVKMIWHSAGEYEAVSCKSEVLVPFVRYACLLKKKTKTKTKKKMMMNMMKMKVLAIYVCHCSSVFCLL